MRYSEAKDPMKPRSFYRRIVLLVFVATAAILFVQNWVVPTFPTELAHALKQGRINRVDVFRCLPTRGMMTNVVAEHDVLFHKFAMMQNTADAEQGICGKFIYNIDQSGSADATHSVVSSQQIIDILSTLRNSYFISGGRTHVIVSDAVYFYDAVDNKIFAVYFWQIPTRVSVAIWDNAEQATLPRMRAKIYENEFTRGLYDKFILEKQP